MLRVKNVGRLVGIGKVVGVTWAGLDAGFDVTSVYVDAKSVGVVVRDSVGSIALFSLTA